MFLLLLAKSLKRRPGSSSGDWKEMHLNWFLGHLLTVIKTICLEAIRPLGMTIR